MSETDERPEADRLHDLAIIKIEAAYAETTAVKEKTAFLAKIESRFADNQPVEYEVAHLEVPVALREIFVFLQQKGQYRDADGDLSFEGFLQRQMDELFQDMLRRLHIRDMHDIPYFRAVWNRVCKDQGHPELAIEDEEETSSREADRCDPF